MSRMEGLFTAWGRILSGRAPNLSIEITRECPLRCPGCYAYGNDHLGGDIKLRQMADLKGDALVARVLHASRTQGDPPVDRRRRAARSFSRTEHTAPEPLPPGHAHPARHQRRAADSDRVGEDLRFQLVVSIDGLQPEHDVRRAPATYDRILKHVAGHRITVHCR